MAFVYAWIVPLWADQLLLHFLMEQFDALPLQCRHIEHMHEGVRFGNISLTLTVRGVSNKHCLLTYFIFALWSPAGKGLTSWLPFVVSNCEFVTFPLVSWVRCGT